MLLFNLYIELTKSETYPKISKEKIYEQIWNIEKLKRFIAPEMVFIYIYIYIYIFVYKEEEKAIILVLLLK